MRTKMILAIIAAGAFGLGPAGEARAWRGGGFGGFHAGGLGGFSSFHAGGFGDGFGSVHYAGASHWGPATGFTHVGGATAWGAGGAAHYGGATHVGWGDAEHYGGWGGYHADSGAWGGYHAAYTYHGAGYGSITHYDTAYHIPGTYGAYGHAVVTPAYGAAVVHGPAGGTVAAYRGPFSAGAVATLPAGCATVAWHGATYYHAGFVFYHPCWYGGTVAYVPVYPPVGFVYAALPVGAVQTVVNNNTYYVSDGVYYQPTMQNGQSGYAVVESPANTGQPVELPPQGRGGGDPFALLKKMSDYLGKQKHIVMKVSEVFDEVAVGGQKIQLSSERTIHLERPDKLEIQVSGGGVQRRIVYDGSVFTVLDQVRNVFASVPMQGALDGVLESMGKEYGMAQPADDLLYSEINARLAGKIATAQYLGQDKVLDKKCAHLAFTQLGVDWEIWIEDGRDPVPRRVVITYVNTPSRPQYTLLITEWETPLIMRGADYKTEIPTGATSASMVTLTGQPAPGQ